MPRTVAIMQPYFFPYPGYHRLLEQSDHFVIYDCVQFPRRGYVHRNRLPTGRGGQGEPRWLSLPLSKAPRDTVIADLRFSQDASIEWPKRLAEHACLTHLNEQDPELDEVLKSVTDNGNVVDYLEATLVATAARLGITAPMSRSSALKIAPEVKGQDRIIAIAKHFDADIYLNAPGGRDFYDHDSMAGAGIALQFLSDYQGPKHSVLYDLAIKPAPKA